MRGRPRGSCLSGSTYLRIAIMRGHLRLSVSSFSLILAVLSGCGSPPEPEPAAPTPKGHFKQTAKGHSYKVVETKDLPALTLDVGHAIPGGINQKGPTNWKEVPPTTLPGDQVLGFFLHEAGTPPQIVIRTAPWPNHGIPLPIEENLDTFYDAMSKKMLAELAPTEPLIEELKLMMIGNRPWVRYVRHHTFSPKGTGKGLKGERQVLKTLEAGKLVSVELQVGLDKILETRDQAYSVAANLFQKEEMPANPPKPEDKPAEKPMDKPADKPAAK